jgi:RNA polymerase sigma-70 factor (ECF subfamily)
MMAIDEFSILVGATMNDAVEGEEYVARALAGDENAYGLIFERYADPIFGFIYRMVGRYDLAEELTQETFVRGYRKLHTLRLHRDVKLSTWLFSIAKNVARESLRIRNRDSRKVGLSEISVEELSDDAPRPDAQLLGRELNHVIQDALRSLDEDKRMAFTLRAIQQLSYKEIAEITGYSVPKLKTDFLRARVAMRHLIGPYLEMLDEL